MNKKYIAECLGTFILTFSVFIAVASSVSVVAPVIVPIIAGLALCLCVYTLGHISGAHLNPAVTVGMLSIKKISEKDARNYIIAQIIGASVTVFLAFFAFGYDFTLSAVPLSSPTFIAEIIGTFIFTFGVASVVYGKVPFSLSGLVVGGSLLLGIVVASLAGSAGILNPAMALSLKSFNVIYVLGPIVGAYLGMNAYKELH